MGELVHAELEHGDRIRAAFRAAPARMRKEMRRSNAKAGRQVRSWERSAAASASPQQRRMARGIGSAGTSTGVMVTLRNTISAPGAMGAFLGSHRFPQFPPAIAPGWKVAGPGGPLVINPTLHAHEHDIESIYLDGQLQAVARTLPR